MFFVALLLLAAPIAVAQVPQGGALSGTVVDAESGDPLADATVAIYDRTEVFITGTATAADGTFSIERLMPATYHVRVSFIGYESVNLPDVQIGANARVDLETIRLVQDASIIGEVEVAAERELIEQRVDRTVYNVAAQPVTTGGNALETLQTLPSIEVDTEGNLSLRGNQNVAVHINGRPVPVRGAMLAAMLRQIPSSNVERVEVLPNPSARHEPDGMSGIINIVLKQGTNRGLAGGLTVGGGSSPNAEVSGNLAYQQGKIDSYLSYGYRHDNWAMNGTSTRVSNLQSGTSTLDQSMLIDNGFNSHLLSGMLDYTLAQGTTIGFNGTLGIRGGNSSQSIDYLFDPLEPQERRTERLTDGDTDGLNADASLSFQRQFDGDTHELTAEARLTRYSNDQLENFTDQVLGSSSTADLTRSTAEDRTDEYSLTVDYNRTLGGIRWETGTKLSTRHLDNDRIFEEIDGGTSSIVPGRTHAFLYDENIYAVYLQGARAFGKLELQAGVRAEVANRDIQLGGASTESHTKSYESLYPSAFAMYNVEPGTSAKLSYSRRVNRPNAFILNPNPRYEDTLMVERGNPELRPEYTDALELTLQYKYLVTVTPFFRRTTDVIRRRMLYNPVNGSTTGTFQNLDSHNTYGADFTLMPSFGPVRGVLSASAYRSVTEGGSIETGLASDGFVWSLRGNLQAKLRPGTDLQFFGFYRAPMDVEDGRISAFGMTSLGISQNLMGEQLRLSVRVNDVFSTSRFEFNTGNEQYTFHGLRDPQMQQVYATLTYTFGQRRPQRRPQAPTQGQQQPDVGPGIGF